MFIALIVFIVLIIMPVGMTWANLYKAYRTTFEFSKYSDTEIAKLAFKDTIQYLFKITI